MSNLENKLFEKGDKVNKDTRQSNYSINKTFAKVELELYLVGEGLKPAFLEGVRKDSSEIALIRKRAKQYNINYITAERPYSILLVGGKNSSAVMDSVLNGDTEKIGLSLGYPEDAVKYFSKEFGKRRVAEENFQYPILKAKNEGKEIPDWLAYISYIPEKLDIINGNVSDSSRCLGERYMNYVRKNNPYLAEVVESSFKRYIDTLYRSKHVH
jgi:hypothetical protein